MTEAIEPQEQDEVALDNELSDESLDRPTARCALICMGWCGSE
jgi:hypothetical protein